MSMTYGLDAMVDDAETTISGDFGEFRYTCRWWARPNDVDIEGASAGVLKKLTKNYWKKSEAIVGNNHITYVPLSLMVCTLLVQ